MPGARTVHIADRRVAGLGAILSELDELDRLRRLIAMLLAEVSVTALNTFEPVLLQRKRSGSFADH